MSIRILLADDHKIVRDGLRTLLEKQADFSVVGEAEDGRSTLKLAAQLSPEIVIMDISMPDMNGMEATRQICEQSPEIRVIGLSMHSDRRFVARMFEAGAAGYLLKDCAFEELVNAIRVVASNQMYVSPSIAGIVVGEYVRQQLTCPSPTELLSPREREVLQLVAEGHSTQQIANTLNVSIKTVETHRLHLMEKLGLHSISELTKYAIREGITSLDQ